MMNKNRVMHDPPILLVDDNPDDVAIAKSSFYKISDT
jgi:hypothetical protein